MKERDIAPGVLAQYNLEVTGISKIRGGYLLSTDEGGYILKESSRTKERIEFENLIHNRLKETGNILSDELVANTEGEYVTSDNYGVKYVIKKWYGGSPCSPTGRTDVIRAIKNLALFHKEVNGLNCVSSSKRQIDIEEQYAKYNTELKRARNFIRKKKRKTDFEIEVLRSFDRYYPECEANLMRLKSDKFKRYKESATQNNEVCHGDFSYHNILFNQERNRPVVISMESAYFGMNIQDVYKFIRKVLEKNNWDEHLGMDLIESYDKIKTISRQERELMSIMMSYPEKFRKLVNHYYNNNKAWISDKNIEKLGLIREQSQAREKFTINL